MDEVISWKMALPCRCHCTLEEDRSSASCPGAESDLIGGHYHQRGSTNLLLALAARLHVGHAGAQALDSVGDPHRLWQR